MFKKSNILYLFSIFYTISITVLVSCVNHNETDVTLNNGYYEKGEEYTAGSATIFDESINAYNTEMPGLNENEHIMFVVGNSFNRNSWVTAPSSTTARDGLGPLFNATSCSGCHILDGRGQPPINGGSSESIVYRISTYGTGTHGEPLVVPDFGDQLNNKSIQGVQNEGDVTITYTDLTGKYPDGSSYTLRKPTYDFTNTALTGVYLSPRVAPKMAGTGFFDAIAEADILKNADVNDANGDGISGKPNYAWDYISNSKKIGRIGWKASVTSVKMQVAHAFLNDIGITSNIFPNENLWGNEATLYQNLINGGTPEIEDSTFYKVYFYTSTLAMPARRNANNADILEGKKYFYESGCTNCHKPSFVTSAHTDIPKLNNQKIYIYSDLLLHDMGSSLADGRPDYEADGREWRTAPLWGIGLQKTVNGHTYFLHDGRARNLEEAILWHGGEASNAKTNFMNLNKSQRDQLIKFLNSL